MRHTLLNTEWSVRPHQTRFAELQGGAAEWTPVKLPHDAVISTVRTASATPATGYYPGGSWEYRRVLNVDAGAESAVVLKFEGVYRDAVVRVNGTIAARWPYGYSTFYVPIDELLRFGEDNEVLVAARVHDDSRWYSGGGIYRNVWLLQAGQLHLVPDALDVRTPEIDDDGAVVTVSSVVRNQATRTSTAQLHVELVDGSGGIVARAETPVTAFAGEEVTTRQRLFVANPRRWDPANPHLYTCRASISDGDHVLDEESTTFGIRSLTLDPHHGLRINGVPTLLRGACVHHDNGPIGAATINRADERRVQLLKAAGFNAIRSAHNPMSQAMLDACDRLGMLVMDEAFDMWAEAKTGDDYASRFPDWWERDVEAMIRKDVNHPCVVMYSIGNEIPDGSTPAGLQWSRALAEKVRGLDDTRFVCQAVTGILVGGPELFDDFRASMAGTDETTGVNAVAMTLAELMGQVVRSPVVAAKTTEAFAHLDVAGYNYMPTRFDIDGDLFPDRMIVATETYPSTLDVDWAGVTDNPNVIGDFTWTGWDYLGEAGIGRVVFSDDAATVGPQSFHGVYPALTAWCGDIDITGHRRPQSYYREIVFGLRADPFIAVQPPQLHGRAVVHSSPWAWSEVISSWTWDGYEGAPVMIEVYADADEVELLVNGRSVGRRPCGAQHRYRTTFETEYEAGQLEAIAWRGGEQLGRTTLVSAIGPVRLEVRADRSTVNDNGTDATFVELTLVDEAGTLHAAAVREITIEVEGPAVLQGFGNANPSTDESFSGAVHTTFKGRALAVIRPTGEGTIVVTATASSCVPKNVRIEARREA